MTERVALIAGASGAIGGALAQHLATMDSWQIVGLCRKPPARPISGVTYVHADMSDPSSLARALGEHDQISHIFYCGRAEHDDRGRESVAANVSLLANVVETVEAISQRLTHVNLVQGGKFYGVHLGPFPTPAREDDARVVTPNFYYDQEDWLRERSVKAAWNWSAARPNSLFHYSPGNARNLISTLGAYAAICKEAGLPLDFPGHAGAYTSLTQVTTTEILAQGMIWMSTTEPAAGNAFNLTNGDVFRWERLWPRLANAFSMRCGVIRPVQLAEIMPAWDEAWQRICARHGLVDQPLSAVANWAFADATLMRYWDEILSTNKARAFGFDGWDDSEQRFFTILSDYRQAGVLPSAD